ncbi:MULTISPECIES: YrhA family protein [Mesonia]|uniref:Uncharacterized protein n=1 Tax=Mesonia oceanica TaxID=2687242 RepID=A0AC61Y713_9FLAO|nr:MULTISPECIES: YrhA family protein [Mesonia]MAN26755.1 hypothetical protein [Mesonia sp.]MAQ40459.1 hypothetical protein [Mesonia sp.]MBJ98080.1 hypothetical protein [Flavobacteriaceae bacterium]VVV00296.1 hypothetical protein FVB9532_01565 [Mesonia oceanica]|tara:strand:+ start:25805 stop:26266 length:462 start_codon:yes stop_codon:yes gene_type:complete
MKDIEIKINEIKNEREEYNLKIPLPINEKNIENFKKKFKVFFDLEVDKDYLSFFKICNGLEENGFIIFSSNNHIVNKVYYGIFENNEFFHEQDEEDKKYILFATSGQDLFVFNKEKSQYQLLDRYTGDVYNEYESFNDMLLYILKLMLNEEVA